MLLRRTRLGLLAARELSAPTARRRAASPGDGAELGWDERAGRVEVERFADEAAAEGLVVG